MFFDILRGAPPYTKGRDYLDPHPGSYEPHDPHNLGDLGSGAGPQEPSPSRWRPWQRRYSGASSRHAGDLGSGAGPQEHPPSCWCPWKRRRYSGASSRHAGDLGSGTGPQEPSHVQLPTLKAAEVLWSLPLVFDALKHSIVLSTTGPVCKDIIF